MNPEPSDKEFEAVLKLSPCRRYKHFLKRVVDLDQVWMAEDEEGLLAFNHQGGEVLPVWPARRYAEHVLNQEWPDARYVRMAIHDWVEKTLRPNIDAEDLGLAVFPDAEGFGEHVLISDMIRDIEAELGSRLGALPEFDPNAEEINLDELLKPLMRASMKAKPKGKLP